MNKSEFIKTLSKKLSISESDALIINNIFEKYFFLSSKNKEKIINELMEAFKITLEEASNIYDIAKNIINKELKYKIFHPFKNQN